VAEETGQSDEDEARRNRDVLNTAQEKESGDHVVDKNKGSGILMDGSGWVCVAKSVDEEDIEDWE